MRALTHTLRSCYIFGKNSISGFDGTNHQFFFVHFMTKIHDLIPKQKQLSEITAIFRRCSYSFCSFVCLNVCFLSRFLLFCSVIAQENAKNENK